MEKGIIELTQKDAENTSAGGVVVGKREGQTMIFDDASLGGYFVGKLHRDGGIKMINKSTGQPLEVQGSEVIITAPAVSDETKREFEGKMMTNREILSKINFDGGGVSFADGGDIPAKINVTDKIYEFGGKMVHDTEIANYLGMNSALKKGAQLFTFGDKTYNVKGIYNAIQKGKISYKTKDIDTFPMKYLIYDKKYIDNVKADYRKPNGIVIVTNNGEEVLIDGNHRMNNAYLKGKKKIKTYYINDYREIAKFTKTNNFEVGGFITIKNETINELIGQKVKVIYEPLSTEKENLKVNYYKQQFKGENSTRRQFGKITSVFATSNNSDNIYDKYSCDVTFDNGEIGFYKLRYVEFYDNNNNYLQRKTIYANGGKIEKQDLAKDAKKGSTPARDLNDYNDTMDLSADGKVGGNNGIDSANLNDNIAVFEAFADGGLIKKGTVINIEKDFLSYTDNSNYKGLYDQDEIDDGINLEWGKYGYSVSESQQDSDYEMLLIASSKFNSKNIGKMYAVVENSDKYNTVNIIDYDMLANKSDLVINLSKNYFDKLKVGRDKNKNVIERLNLEVKKINDLKAISFISDKLKVPQEKGKEIIKSLQYPKEYYEKNKNNESRSRFDVYYKNGLPTVTFTSLKETFDYIQSEEFVMYVYNSTPRKTEIYVHLFDWNCLNIKYDLDGHLFKPNGETDWNSNGKTLTSYPFMSKNISSKQDFIESFKKIISDFIEAYNYYVVGSANQVVKDNDNLDSILDSIDSAFFAKGGVVYDTTKPKVDKVTIVAVFVKDSSRGSVIGRYASTVSELQSIVADYLYHPASSYDYIGFSVNDSKAKYYFNLNRGKKNTVRNVNPDTLNSANFKRIIDSKIALTRNFDWTDFFENITIKSGNSTQPSITVAADKIDSVEIMYYNKNTSAIESSKTYNLKQLYNELNRLRKRIANEVTLTPIGTFVGAPPYQASIDNIFWDNIFEPINYDYNKGLLMFGEALTNNVFPSLDSSTFNSRAGIKVAKAVNTNTPTTNTSTGIDKPTVSAVQIEITDRNNNQTLRTAINILQFVSLMEDLFVDISYNNYNFSITPFENQYNPFPSLSISVGTYQNVNPKVKATLEIFKYLERQYPDLDWSEFAGTSKKGVNASSTSTPTKINLAGTKINVKILPELSKVAQEIAFKQGFKWAGIDNDDVVSFTEQPFLIFSAGKSITYRETDSGFKSAPEIEIFADDLFLSAPSANSVVDKKFDLSNTKIWIGDDPKLNEKIQEKAFELGWTWTNMKNRYNFSGASALFFDKNKYISYSDSKKDEYFSRSPYKEIFISDLFDTVPINNESNLFASSSKSRLNMFLELKKIVDEENLQVIPANIPLKDAITQNPIFDFVDSETGDVFSIVKINNNLFPINKESSSFLFEFLTFVKDFNSFLEQNLIKLLKESVADEKKLFVKERFESVTGDFQYDEKDLIDLKKLLPSFQEVKFAQEKATILKEIKRLHEKITYNSFIKTNELLSGADQLFTAQGLLKYYFSQTTQSPTAKLDPACGLPSPNGLPSKLPLSAYFNVRTEQFKSWFGDWEQSYETNNYLYCSKMIDEDTKEPKIYYHGVRKYVSNFGQFSNMGQGVVRPYGSFEPPTAFPASYFSDGEDYAKFYGGDAPNMPKPSADYEPFIYKVFLSAKNPLDLTPLGFEASYRDVLDYLMVAYGIRKNPSQNVLSRINNDMNKNHPVWVYVRNDVSLLEIIKEYGYDALFQIGDVPSFDINGNPVDDRTQSIKESEYLTFYPSQIKSATVLKSFYFDFFKDIRFKNGGYVCI